MTCKDPLPRRDHLASLALDLSCAAPAEGNDRRKDSVRHSLDVSSCFLEKIRLSGRGTAGEKQHDKDQLLCCQPPKRYEEDKARATSSSGRSLWSTRQSFPSQGAGDDLDEQGWMPLLLLGLRQPWSDRKRNLDGREWSPSVVTAQSPSIHLHGHGTNGKAVCVLQQWVWKHWSLPQQRDGAVECAAVSETDPLHA